MCIIAAKPRGVKMPSKTTIENMWFNNHDGAGFMYAHDGKVHIEKGFMKLSDFESALERVGKTINLDDVSVVMHFRIATHGGVSPANTHPFPVSTSIGLLQKLKCKAPLGVAHNGIINITPRKGISDTMEYIATQLAPLYKGVPHFYNNPHLMELVENGVQSKLAIMNGDGEIYTVGKFETDKDILYSNDTFKPYAFYGKFWKDTWSDYYMDDDYDALPWYTFKGEKLLRWFDYDEEIILLDSKNRWIDNYDGDYAVDTDGLLYRLDYNIGGFIKVEGGRAFDSKNELIVAQADNDELVTLERVYEYKPVKSVNNKLTKNKK